MKAAVLNGIGELGVSTVATPEVGQGQALMKVKACGICGSDVRILNSGNPRITFPAILGHELAGEIVKVGEGVEKFHPGDRIAVGADIPCGSCNWCTKGLSNNCIKHMAMGYQFQGGFAEYCLLEKVVLEHGPVFKLPQEMEYAQASLMEPLTCCLNGMEIVNMQPGETVLILGGGPIGCMLSLLAKAKGAEKVILAEYSKKRMELAKKLADADLFVLNSEDELKRSVQEATSGEGIDITITACPSSSAQEEAVELAAKRGRINFFGGLPADSPPIKISSNKVHYDEICITGSHGSTPAHNREALDMLASGKFAGAKVVTHTVSLDNITKGFELLKAQEALKVVVFP